MMMLIMTIKSSFDDRSDILDQISGKIKLTPHNLKFLKFQVFLPIYLLNVSEIICLNVF